MKPNKHYIALLLALGAAGVSAQTLRENVAVDGRYTPDIIRQDRINTLPKRLTFDLARTPLNYSQKSVAADFSPTLLPLAAPGWMATKQWDRSPGYLDLGAGSYLNAVGSFGYRFIDTEETLFGVRIQHNSTSLGKVLPVEGALENTQKRFDDVLSFFGGHDFGVGRLDAQFRWHLGWFNYSGFYVADTQTDWVPPTQTLNDVYARVGWTAAKADNGLTWGAAADVHYFGYRAAYDGASRESGKGTKEANIGISGNVGMPLADGSSVGADVRADIVLNSQQAEWAPEIDNYVLVDLNPHYRFTQGLLNIKVGAKLDIAGSAGPEDDRYGAFHIAPDIRLDWQQNLVGLYLHLLGGSRLQTLANLWQLDYYQNPVVLSTRPVYEPVDGRLGLNFGPFSGFTAGLSVGYKSSRGVLLGGGYMGPWGGRTALAAQDYENQLNISGLQLAANISYTYSGVADFKADVTYQQQKGTTGWFNGYDRPKLTADAELAVHPVKPLKLMVGFNYRGDRTFYQSLADINGGMPPVIINGAVGDHDLIECKLEDLMLLRAGVAYQVTPKFNIWVEADNLLGKKHQVLPFQPMQGLGVAGGFGVRF